MSTDAEEKRQKPPEFGRTPWDFAAEAIRSRTAMFFVACLFLLVPLGVHYFAEPASEINLFGLIKYKKAVPPVRELPAQPVPVGPAPATYLLPDKQPLRHGETAPLLDGSINMTAGYTDNEMPTCILSGANIRKVQTAARSFDGHALKLQRQNGPGDVGVILGGWEKGCVYEVAYLERVFEVSLKESGHRTFQLSARQIPTATLDLLPYNDKK